MDLAASTGNATKMARGKLSLAAGSTMFYSCVQAGARVFALEVVDNSMRPDLVAGDIVVCDPDRPVALGGIVARSSTREARSDFGIDHQDVDFSGPIAVIGRGVLPERYWRQNRIGRPARIRRAGAGPD